MVEWIKDTYSTLLPWYCASLDRDGLSAPPFSYEFVALCAGGLASAPDTATSEQKSVVVGLDTANSKRSSAP